MENKYYPHLFQKGTVGGVVREFDTFPNEKQRISRMNAYIFLSNLLFLYIGFFGFLRYNGIEVKKLKVNTSKSKNAESFYIKQSYIDSNGKSTSRTIRKLGTLKELLVEHGPTRDDVMAWAKEQARIETEKFEQEKANHCIPITFHPNRKIAHGEKRKFQGGYLFLQSLYYELGLNKVCRKIRDKHHYDYDLNAILSDLIYTRILEPGSKRSSFETAKTFLEAPTYQLHDIYRALNVLSEECDLIQSELYRNSKSVLKRNDGVLYYDCTNYYFEIEQEDGDKKYGKSKEHRPNPIVQMGLFTDGDGIPLAFSIFPGNQNEQTSLKPLEKKVIQKFGCSESRWQIEACFRIMKTDFSARPVFVQRNDRIRTHFLICFLALFIYRLLEKKLERKYTCEELLSTLRDYEFADVQGQGFIPIYESTKLTDALHEVAGFETDYEFLTKRKMKEIQKLSKQSREKS